MNIRRAFRHPIRTIRKQPRYVPGPGIHEVLPTIPATRKRREHTSAPNTHAVIRKALTHLAQSKGPR